MTTALSPRSPRATGAGALLILGAMLTSLPAGRARSDGPAPAPKAAASWPNA